MRSDSIRYTAMRSPIGTLHLLATARGLTSIRFETERPAPTPGDWIRDEGPFGDTVRQLEAYFEGSLREFQLDLDPHGTGFQRTVWTALLDVPWGTTTSYGEIARRIGKPSAVRAVGAANGRNPIPIVVPCHRIVGADGSLTGYGGGLHLKRWLLAHEGIAVDDHRIAPQLGLDFGTGRA